MGNSHDIKLANALRIGVESGFAFTTIRFYARGSNEPRYAVISGGEEASSFFRWAYQTSPIKNPIILTNGKMRFGNHLIHRQRVWRPVRSDRVKNILRAKVWPKFII